MRVVSAYSTATLLATALLELARKEVVMLT